MEKPSVYVETSIISYLAARPGRDPITRLRQEATWEWWNRHRLNFRLLISDEVVVEIKRGDMSAAKKRIEIARKIEDFSVTSTMRQTADRLLTRSLVSDPEDAVHIAAAATQGMDYLLTWNFKHINNSATKKRIAGFLVSLGLICPHICTPIDILQGECHDRS